MISSRLHPNTQTAWRIVFVTLLAAAGVASLFVFGSPISESDTARIAFASHDGNDFEIFTVNPDGSDLIQITNNAVDDWGATWSPDHSQIALRSGNVADNSIYVMDADGTNMQRILPAGLTIGDPFHQGTMTWSPDGTQLAFSANFNGNWDLWVSRIDDQYLTRLTNDMGEALHPDWSPDGTQIAFNRYDTDGLLEIYSIDLATQRIHQLTDLDGMVMYPRWSPDGTQIAFFINDDSQADIYVMDMDSNIRQLTKDIAVDRVAVFSPDGNALVFRSERDGDSDIYTLNLNNGNISPVTHNTSMDMAPDW